jgi:hypothetical protein
MVEFNRAMGIGVERPASEEELDGVMAWVQERASTAWVLQIAPVARSAAI